MDVMQAETMLNFVWLKKKFSVKKAAKLLNFCLIGKILHNFPMPISIEPAPKSFICIQILLWRRVCRTKKFTFEASVKT